MTQAPSEFLWGGGFSKSIGPVLMLAPMALFAALPTSLGMMFPWGRDASAEAPAGGEAAKHLRTARLLGLAWLVGLGVMCVLGVGNPRYAMPAAGLLAPMTCYAVAGAYGSRPWFGATRLRLARRITLGKPLAVPAILVSAAVLGNYASVRWQRDVDGRAAGRVLDAAVGVSADVWADDLIEARPDVLLYARGAAVKRGVALRPLWKKSEMTSGNVPPSGTFIVLRVDGGSREKSVYEQAIVRGAIVAAGDGRVGQYEFRVYRVP